MNTRRKYMLKNLFNKIHKLKNAQLLFGILLLIIAIPINLKSQSKEREVYDLSQEIELKENDPYYEEYETIEAPEDGGSDPEQNVLEETDFWKIADYPLSGILDLKINLNQFLKENGYTCQTIHFLTSTLSKSGGTLTYDVKIGNTNDLVHVILYLYDVKHEFTLAKDSYKSND